MAVAFGVASFGLGKRWALTGAEKLLERSPLAETGKHGTCPTVSASGGFGAAPVSRDRQKAAKSCLSRPGNYGQNSALQNKASSAKAS